MIAAVHGWRVGKLVTPFTICYSVGREVALRHEKAKR
jgi:hypothetical protein